MARIPQDFIDTLLERTDIVPLIEARVSLKKTGREYQARCPFHDERTPSFTVSPTKQFYHCFGCGAHGTAISFLMEYDRLEFLDTVELLAQQAGLELPQGTSDDGQSADRIKPLYEVMEAAARYYRKQLRDTPDAATYFKNRGVTGATAKQFGLGFAPDEWHSLDHQLPDTRSAIAAGLLIERDDGKHHDRFRNRAMFPIRDTRGRTIAFGGRTLGDDKAKYLNSPETPLFHKSRHVYGLFEARQALRDLPRLLVVEGYMDVISLAQNGFANTVATLGTATTPEHLTLLFRHTEEVVFCFDGDAAGQRAAEKAMHQSLPVMRGTRRVRFLFLPDGEDPDSLVRSDNGRERFQTAIDATRPLSTMLLDHVTDGLDIHSAEGRTQIKGRARPLLSALPADIFRTELTKSIAELTNDRPEDLQISLSMSDKPAAWSPPTAPSNQRRPDARAIRVTAVTRALQLLMHNPVLAEQIANTDNLRNSSKRGADIVADAVEFFRNDPNLSLARWLERYRDEPTFDRLQDIAATPPPGNDAEQHRQSFLDSIGQLSRTSRQNSLRERYTTLVAYQDTRQLDANETAELKQILKELKPT